MPDAAGVRPSPVPTRAAAGLPETGFVFCCFNQHFKITARDFDIWMRLLQRVEGSVLWLRCDRPAAQDNLRQAARKRGVDPARLIFAPRASLEDHLARHGVADLFLDTQDYNAHMTGVDALLGGLPLVTCTGRGFIARVATSVLHAAGLSDLVTASVADYEVLAFTLATDPEKLRAVRARVDHARQHAVLFDTDRTRRHIEAAYRTMVEIARSGDSPRAFAVAPL
jgi:predicted O-linked N-acetylglucosamine transferase (SPINDLY family)